MNLRKTLLIILFLPVFAHCSIRKMAIGQMTDLIKDGRIAFESEVDLEIAETALASNLKLLEAVQVSAKDNHELNLFLAEGYNNYTLAFVEDKYEALRDSDSTESERQRKRAINFYMRARSYALLVLKDKLDKDLSAINENEFQKAISKLKKEDVPALFWFSLSWGAALNLSRDDTEALSLLGKVERGMARVKELDPNFFYGGVYLFEGVYYGARSPMLGGDHSRSKKAFQKAHEISQGKLLMVPVMEATTLCLQIQDRGCFEEKLKMVINKNVKEFPKVALANAVAQKKAKRWLSKVNDFFLPLDESQAIESLDESDSQ